MDLKSLVAEFQNYHYSDKIKVDNAEFYYALWASRVHSNIDNIAGSIKTSQLSSEIAAIRKQINDVLASDADDSTAKQNHHHHHHHEEKHDDIGKRVTYLESENKHMKSQISDLKDLVEKLQATIGKLTASGVTVTAAGGSSIPTPKPAAKKVAEAEDEIDLFGSDEEEDEEAARIKEQRLKAYQEKKAKKPGPIAKSSVILDVKPWDDETDMGEMEKVVRSIAMDGLLWGASKLVPVGYGIRKLQIMCVVEDDKVSVEELQEKIEGFDDFVQSVDIAAFNKI